MLRSIPHTIIRNGIYWLNLHTPSGRLRLSLSTREPLQAMHWAGGLIHHLRSAMLDYANLKQLKLIAQRWLEEKTIEAEWMLSQVGIQARRQRRCAIKQMSLCVSRHQSEDFFNPPRS